jgi:glycosyltransferase involved in cell wall biosynthesis
VKPGITVVVPSIAPRGALLERALRSLHRQWLLPDDLIVVRDSSRAGAAATRQRGLEKVETEWTAFLDDDDEFKPEHLRRLSAFAQEHGADYVFSWYDVVGGTDPRPDEFGLPWDPANPRQTTVTTLVRTGLALEVGGFVDQDDAPLDSPDRHCAGEDWLFTKRMNDAGAIIHHLPERTWLWHHHAHNTSGLPSRW